MIMNIFNMYVLQCILCASERNSFQIYGAIQIKIIIIIHCDNIMKLYKYIRMKDKNHVNVVNTKMLTQVHIIMVVMWWCLIVCQTLFSALYFFPLTYTLSVLCV